MNYLTFFKSKTVHRVIAMIIGLAFISFTTFEIRPDWNPFKALNGSSPVLQNNHQNHLANMNFDYEKTWKEIDSLEQKGLPKSALAKTEELLEFAKKENNALQTIKALMYRGKYQSQLEEDGLPKAIFRLEEEAALAEYPVKPVLLSMLAEMYQGYLDNNSSQFQERTQTVDFKNDDIRTWTLEQLTVQSSALYWTSIADPRLKNSSIEAFKPILTDGKNEEGLRPTLYDFLAHRAIDYFMNERTYLTQPAYKFYIDDERAFAPSEDFVKWKISTKDTASQKFNTLRLFQDLLAFRQLEKVRLSPSLLDTDLKRLRFVYDNSVLDTKDAAYLKALETLKSKFAGSPPEAEIIYQIASHYNSKGADWQPVPPGNNPGGKTPPDEKKWLWKKAHDLCAEAIDKYPGSFGAKQCAVLKAQFLQKSLNAQTELVNLPDKPFLARLDYRNVPQVWLKVIRFDASRREKFEKLQSDNNTPEQIIQYFNSLKPVKQWSVNLPDDGDFRQHAAEIKMDKLPLGQYLVVLSDNSSFTDEESAVGYLFTHVSRLGFWNRQGDGGESEFIVFNRESGEPLAGVTGEFFSQNYNSLFRKYEWKKVGTQKSNADGFMKPAFSGNENRNFKVLLRNGNDTLDTNENYYNYTYSSENRQYQQTSFFLDRAIYRPGQTVYFKAIALEFDEKRMPRILKNEAVTITFRDANYQEVSKLEMRTNEYGTVSGNFTAPRSGLLGQMQLQSSIGGQAQAFRVEEYKRPKFEVAFEPVEGSFRLNDTVIVKGTAQAYAGNNIDGAQVTWRVVREVNFPWMPWWYWKWFPQRGETMEIANGAGTTDTEGKFNVKFAALPDRSISADKKPEFSYTVYADVTDITGETQVNETYVKVGYISMRADVPIAEQVNIDSLKKFSLVTENLNGQFEPAQGSLTLELLKSPDRIYIQRYWELTDNQVMPEAEFKKTFPQFAWKTEDQPQNWAVERSVLNENFDTKEAKEVILSKIKFAPGWYALTLKTKDKYDVPVEVKKYISLFDLNARSLPSPVVGWHFFENKNYEPGETVRPFFGTSEKALQVLLEIEKDGKTINRKWLKVNGIQSSDYLVREEDRGNVSYLYSWAGCNRSQNASGVITVPWSNKDLTIEYGTFRDKLQPGQKEEWVIKIKGPKGEKVAAEMVAGMYDASLDAFAANSWGLSVFPASWARIRYSAGGFGLANDQWLGHFPYINTGETDYREYRRLNWFNWYFQGGGYHRFKGDIAYSMAEMEVSDRAMMKSAPAVEAMANGMAADSAAPPAPPAKNGFGGDEQAPPKKPVDLSQVKVRTNLDETVFFFPNLMTDAEGNVLIKFTMNEALTRWKFLGLAHTADLKIGATMKEVVTQKDLMVVPNPPRFFRENDEIEFTAKVVNLTDKPLSGNAQLQLVNPMETMPVFKWEDNPQFNQNFTVEAKQSARLAWRFKVPDVADVPVIEHTVVAAAGEFSDAERSAAPVLSNRMLVTETLPLPVRGKETKTFVLKSLKENNSTTLRSQGLTLEFTQNPAWYAVQALPYLMEYPYECTEQIFSRYYANSLATSVANSHPKIKAVFDKWRAYQPAALASNLSKNQELKTALLEETPWVLQAQSEEQQKQNIALLFDLNRMAYEQEASLAKLQERQMPGGGWAWFPGGRDDWYITQYIVEGLGHMHKLGVIDVEKYPETWRMVTEAVRYCDARMVEYYEQLEKLVKEGKTKWEDDHMGYMAAHYLYTRSFFLEDKSAQASTGGILQGKKSKVYINLEGKVSTVFDYYTGQAEKYWLNKGMYTEGMLSLALSRMGKAAAATQIVRSLKERSLNNEEFGMYWKYPTGWWWYTAPIETHSLMIEVFNDVANDKKAVDDLKVWLLKNKQTNHWKTTKATALSVYALLMSGDNWLLDSQPLGITFGSQQNTNATDWKASITKAQNTAEAGTGYFKVKFDGSEVSKDMANVTVSNPNNVVAWGGMYWQYFEQLDKIKTFEETPLTIKKQLFRVENSPTGEVLRPIKEGESVEVGEKLKARIELRVDRDMEYVHMKDMRASGFEPVNVLSSYKWQGGLGYYESTRDASTNFFFSMLPKGTHVFEYPLRVVHKGDFSNGITTVQCMYAPEFSSHSEGIRVKVE